jgi:hypothetical protein
LDHAGEYLFEQELIIIRLHLGSIANSRRDGDRAKQLGQRGLKAVARYSHSHYAWAMIVSQKQGFVWIHNPKVAGTSFRATIQRYHDWPTEFASVIFNERLGKKVDISHLRMWELPVGFPDLWALLPSLTTAVFVRDPLRRFISSCFQHYRQWDYGMDILNVPRTRQQIAIRSVMDRLTPELLRFDARYVHFTPQREFIFLDGERIIRHVIPLSDIASAYETLGIPQSESPRVVRGDCHARNRRFCPPVLRGRL